MKMFSFITNCFYSTYNGTVVIFHLKSLPNEVRLYYYIITNLTLLFNNHTEKIRITKEMTGLKKIYTNLVFFKIT